MATKFPRTLSNYFLRPLNFKPEVALDMWLLTWPEADILHLYKNGYEDGHPKNPVLEDIYTLAFCFATLDPMQDMFIFETRAHIMSLQYDNALDSVLCKIRLKETKQCPISQ